MKEENKSTNWPRWHDLLDLMATPYLGAFVCMVIAPLYVFSKKVRIELDNDGATGGLTILAFIWIGCILWAVGFFVGLVTLFGVLNQ